MNYKNRLIFSVLLIVLLVSCSIVIDDIKELGNTKDIIEINDFEEVQKYNIEELPSPERLILLESDTLVVFDIRNNRGALSEDGSNKTHYFGRSGSGPGEFRNIVAVQKTIDNNISFIDDGRSMIHYYDSRGVFVQSYDYERGRYESDIKILDQNVLFQSVLGKGGNLIEKKSLDGSVIQQFGTAMGPEPEFSNLDAERRILSNGVIPDFYKNDLRMAVDQEHIFVFFEATGILQYYSAEGDLVWERKIVLPVINEIFESAVERAQEPGPQNTIPQIRSLSSMKIVNDTLYLFFQPHEKAKRTMLAINENGELVNRYQINEGQPRFSDIAVDPSNNEIYLIAPESATLFKADLPI